VATPGAASAVCDCLVMVLLAVACDCDVTGTVAESTCEPRAGQCMCHGGVAGRRCDHCLPGFYNFSASGCSRTCSASAAIGLSAPLFVLSAV